MQSRQCWPATAGNDSARSSAGGVPELGPELGPRGAVLGMGVLRLDDRGLAAVGQAELDQLGAARPGRPGELVDRAVVDGVLVEAELDVALDRPCCWAWRGRS